MTNWKTVNLHGGQSIAKVCGLYEVTDFKRLPNGKFKIKVLERTNDFIALANIAPKADDGSPDWTAGLGQTADEALADLIERVMESLKTREEWTDDQLEWSHPQDF